MYKIRNIVDSIPVEFKKKFYLVIFFNFLVGIVEMLTVASILPFMIILINPESFSYNNFFSNTFISSSKVLAIYFALLMIFMATLSLFLSIFNIWLTNKFTFDLSAQLSSKLFANLMFLDFSEFLKKSTSDLISKITHQVQRYADGVIGSILIIFQKMSTIIILIIFLLFINFKISLVTIILIFLFYIFYFKNIKGKISNLGLENTVIIQDRQKVLQDNFSCIKELKIYNKEDLFVESFNKLSFKYAYNIANNRVFASAPRYIFELLIIILSLSMALYYFGLSAVDLTEVVPVISLFVLSVYKIIPATQSIFSCISSMKSEIHSFDTFKDDLNNFNKIKIIDKTIEFEDNVNFKNLSFNFYDDKNNNVNIFDDISFKIKKNKILGIFGKSGSGKTTLLNIIACLLRPKSGEIYIDNNICGDQDIDMFKKKIGFVSQSTVVFNDSIEKNITLFDSEINKTNLLKSLELSGLSEFISKLPNGLNTQIGEKGLNFSGGQLQRMSIARAIYRNREILLLDEATSALDLATEESIIKSIKSLKNITIVLSTHKLDLLDYCDSIIALKNKKIIFNQDVEKNQGFLNKNLLKDLL
jgi:ABC-type dipeptide/oligopeptide/nickel transport system ATPase component